MDEERNQILITIAKDLANQHTDTGLAKATEILLQLIYEGCEDPKVLMLAATYLLQGPQAYKYDIKQKAISLADSAVSLAPEDISVLEAAIACYVLIQKEFPDKLDDIIRLSLKLLDLDPGHVESMITLASHREHPRVKLSLEDAIGMMEWAKEIQPANVIIDFTLARLYAEAGNYGKAKALYQQVVPEAGPNPIETPDAREPINPTAPKSTHKRYRKYGRN